MSSIHTYISLPQDSKNNKAFRSNHYEYGSYRFFDLKTRRIVCAHVKTMDPAKFIIICVICQMPTLVFPKRPNVVFIMADDYGWNDVSWHNRHMPTPNIEALAMNGVILNQSYVNQMCTPTRSAFLTGHYPYHLGTEHGVFHGATASAVPLRFTFLPEILQRLGYKTHMIGKWHVGYCNVSYVPTGRGFDSFYGYYMGAEDYYTHIYDNLQRTDYPEHFQGLDFWDDLKPVYKNGVYSTEIYANKSIEIIRSHNASKPFFLYYAFQSVHYPLQVPSHYLGPCHRIRNEARRIYCGMVNALDIAVGKLINVLKETGHYDNTIIIFNTDNGGQTLDGGNNWPLRGNKNTLWEGGNRAISFIHAPKFIKRTGVSERMFSIVDWFPTILSAIGKKINRYGDGVNQWDMILNDVSKRNSFVYNIDKNGASIRQGRHKLIVGQPGEPSGWIPEPSGNVNRMMYRLPEKGPWLFDIKNDPTERKNLASRRPRLVKKLKKAIRVLAKSMAPTAHRPYDPRGNPKFHNGTMATGWC